MHTLKPYLRKGFISLSLLVFSYATVAQEAPSSVEQLVREANERIAGGESPEVVEQTLRDGFDEQGLKAQVAPPSWDVFARSRWENNDSPDENKSRQGHRKSPDAQAPFVIGANHTVD
jgi:hypothetical protein